MGEPIVNFIEWIPILRNSAKNSFLKDIWKPISTLSLANRFICKSLPLGVIVKRATLGTPVFVSFLPVDKEDNETVVYELVFSKEGWIFLDII